MLSSPRYSMVTRSSPAQTTIVDDERVSDACPHTQTTRVDDERVSEACPHTQTTRVDDERDL